MARTRQQTVELWRSARALQFVREAQRSLTGAHDACAARVHKTLARVLREFPEVLTENDDMLDELDGEIRAYAHDDAVAREAELARAAEERNAELARAALAAAPSMLPERVAELDPMAEVP